MKKLLKFTPVIVATIGIILTILLFFDGGRLFVASLIGATGAGEDYIYLTRQEKDEIASLSQHCGCEVKFYYESVTTEDGEALPAIGSNGRNDGQCIISFSWEEEQKDKSLCRRDTSYLRRFALSLLPELFEKMRYVKDYPTILFIFSTDDDTHPVNGTICEKSIIIKK